MKLSAPKAARWAGVTRQTVTRWIRLGQVKAERDRNGKWVVDMAEVMRRADHKFKHWTPVEESQREARAHENG